MNGAQGIAAALSTCSLATSSDAVEMDDLVVVSLFSPQIFNASIPRHSHIPPILGNSFTYTGKMLYTLRRLFKEHQLNFDVTDSTKYILSSIEFMDSLKDILDFAQLGDAKLAVLQWCICAHAMLLHPASPVNRSVDHTKRNIGYGLAARSPILADQVIWECIGVMPGDGEVISELASVTVAPAQNQPEGDVRTLYGPLRLATHRCRNYNAELVSLESTSAFMLYAIQNIQQGEWITVNHSNHRSTSDTEIKTKDCACADCMDDAESNSAVLSTKSQCGLDKRPEELQARMLHHRPPALIAALEAREAFTNEIEGGAPVDFAALHRQRKGRKRYRQRERAKLERAAAAELAKK